MSVVKSVGRMRAVARRHALALRRSPHRFFDVTVWPVVDCLLFGTIGIFAERSGGGALAAGYLLVGVVLWHVIYQAQIALSTGFLEETWTRNLLNLMVTPITELEYAGGVALFGFVKLIMGVGLVALTAFVFYAFDITQLGIGAIPVVAILLMIGWIIALFVIGLVLRFGTGAEALAWGILFAVMPLSGVFYPVDALPGVLQPIALTLPTTHAFEAGRGLLDGRGVLWGELGIAMTGTLFFTAITVWFLSRMMAMFRKRGYITRYS
jgi:ABC-2 type transport system permease protein